jgi:ubiquinone/menaquinone biosynthesis C-methylase UbiE
MMTIIHIATVLLMTQGSRYEIDRVAYDDFIDTRFSDVLPKAAIEISKECDINQGLVLDIGFTAPYISLELSRMSSAHFDVLVVDSIEAKICSTRIAERGLAERFTIHIATVDSLPFTDTAFVLVIAREAMRFWQQNEKAYREINRVLKNQGLAILGAGFGTVIDDSRAQLLWSSVQQWRLDTGCEPWAATKPVPDEIEKTLQAAGIQDYSMVVEGDCTCRTVIQWQKPTSP